MKAIQAIKIVGGALVVVASLNVYAQASDAAVASGAMAAPSTKEQSKATKAANRALQKKVRGALAKAKGITVANITVRARGGAVVLQGSVPEPGQIEQATEVAKGVEGVTSVKNALTIRPEGGM
jgi:hyperosmotically inducible periplasmic protein